MNRKYILSLALGALAIAGVSGCKGGGGGNVATIDGEVISNEEYVEYLKTKPTVRASIDGQVVEVPVSNSLAFQAMQDLVGKKILISLAKEAKVEPTDADVENEIKFRNELTPGYLQQLKDQGRSMAEIRRDVYYSLASERLITKGITVPMAEVDAYIKANPQMLVEPASVIMDIVFVPSKAARDAADAEFAKGAAFDTVKLRHDQAPTELRRAFDTSIQTNRGLPIDSLQATFKTAINSTEPGKVTAWIPADTGFAKLKVIKKNPKKDVQMTEARKQYLQRQMMMDRGSQANDLQDKISKKMQEAKINVTEESLKDQWPKFMEQLKKEGATPSVPTTGGTTGAPAP